MKKMPADEYALLVADTEVLASDKHGVKVLRTPDGRIIKLFRLKRAWSSARLWPYATRFARNAETLRRCGFTTVRVTQRARIDTPPRTLVVYRELPGQSLRDFLQDGQRSARQKEEALEQMAVLLARLHARGFLFRSIHFGNVLMQDSGIALIDVADLHKRWCGALSSAQRLRNFHHILRYPEDHGALENYGFRRFVDNYMQHAGMKSRRRDRLTSRLEALFRA